MKCCRVGTSHLDSLLETELPAGKVRSGRRTNDDLAGVTVKVLEGEERRLVVSRGLVVTLEGEDQIGCLVVLPRHHQVDGTVAEPVQPGRLLVTLAAALCVARLHRVGVVIALHLRHECVQVQDPVRLHHQQSVQLKEISIVVYHIT